jgi:ATP-dependent DNA helicase RecG
MFEDQNTEWKEMWKDEYLAWICGFANSQGGRLIIGKSNNGSITGIRDVKKLLVDLPNKIRDAMGIIVDIKQKRENDLAYLQIDIPAYPVAVACKGTFYYRSGSTNQKLTGHELERFILRRRGRPWDSAPIAYVTEADLKDSAFKIFKENASMKNRLDKSILSENNASIIDKLNLKEGDFLTTAAVLLFHEDPEKWVTGAYVKIGFFESHSELLYQDEVHGPLLEQAKTVVDLVYHKYLRAKISYEGLVRRERYPYPVDALREAVLNAIVHKNYSYGNPIQISVYDNCLYIANDGSLPETWTIEDLYQKHPSKPHNPNIAYVFYLAGFIETWGRGIEKILEACRKDGIPLPEYRVKPTDIMLKFNAPADRIIRKPAEKVPDKVTNKVTEKAAARYKVILDLISDDPSVSTTAMSTKVNVSRKTVKSDLAALKSLGIVERKGPPRGGYWIIHS